MCDICYAAWFPGGGVAKLIQDRVGAFAVTTDMVERDPDCWTLNVVWKKPRNYLRRTPNFPCLGKLLKRRIIRRLRP